MAAARTSVPDRQCELRSPGGEAFNGQRTDEKIVSSGVETLDGELLRFQTEINSGQEPIDVPEVGRVAMLADPLGATLGLIQPVVKA